jgi:hypothetical protein
MANMKIVSLVSSEALRTRAALLDDLANMATNIAQELLLIDHRLKGIQREIERLDAQRKRPAVDPSLSQDDRSDIVDASYEKGGVPPKASG